MSFIHRIHLNKRDTFCVILLLCVAHCSASDNELIPTYIEGAGLVQIPRSRFDPDYLARVKREEQARLAPLVQAVLDAHADLPDRVRAFAEKQTRVLYMDLNGKAHASLE